MKRNGFSLIEILVAMAIFSLVITILSRSILSSLMASRKSDSAILSRENASFALNYMERSLRTAKEIISPCLGTPLNYVDFIDENSTISRISCNPSTVCNLTTNTFVSFVNNTNGQTIRLTNPERTCITACEFVCNVNASILNTPPSVKILLQVNDKHNFAFERTGIRLETEVSLRAY